jgi:putative transposase
VTSLQTCIVHMIRNSLDSASWKELQAIGQLVTAIKPIYTALSAGAAQVEVNAFEHGPWIQKFPCAVRAGRRAWDRVMLLFAFSAVLA